MESKEKRFCYLRVFFFIFVIVFLAKYVSVQADESFFDFLKPDQLSDEELVLFVGQAIKGEPILLEKLEHFKMPKCLTPFIVDLERRHLDQRALGYNSESSACSNPTGFDDGHTEYTYTTDHFVLHYKKDGKNAVSLKDIDPADGVPDFVTQGAEYLETAARQYYLDQDNGFKFLPPLSAPVSEYCGLDSTRYHVFYMEADFYGATMAWGSGDNPWDDRRTYIIANHDFPNSLGRNDDPEGSAIGLHKVTLAHELFHAIQGAYDFSEDIWFMEGSATAMEDVIFDEVNDNVNYLQSVSWHPEKSLVEDAYGSFVLFEFFMERYDNANPGVIQRMLEESIDLNGNNVDAFEALEIALAEKIIVEPNKAFDAAFDEFAGWMYFTGKRDDGLHFHDGSKYTAVRTKPVERRYPAQGGSSLFSTPDALGRVYVVFKTNNLPGDEGNKSLFFNFYEADGQADFSVNILFPGGSFIPMSLTNYDDDGFVEGEIQVDNPGQYDKVIMVISSLSRDGEDFSFRYSATIY